ncbi:MAG: VCBS repeat-containing protein [Cyclobacteriaceae bacterium]
MKKWLYHIASVSLIILLGAFACAEKDQVHQSSVDPIDFELFRELSMQSTGIDFENKIIENSRINILTYLYYYNGSGVAVGDINNDGLPDIYFAATTGKNKLYLNLGNLKFKDISKQAGVEGRFGITTGVSFVDINNDGFLDIYVCKSGEQSRAYRTNQLFVNNGKLGFIDMAGQYGLDDASFSNQAYFFDMDRDGDLDMYLVNHPIDWLNANKIMTGDQELNGFDYNASDKLYRNNGNGKFDDITTEAGIKNRSWGLSASIGDFNNDGWPDIYVANDFIKPDLLYINNRNGSFSNQLKDHFRHTSFFSMGSDFADINNDGHNDLYVVDMAMKGHVRSKRNMGSMSTENFKTILRRGYHYNYAINTLQLNLGNNQFAEIAQMAGVDKTDWSWSPLVADLDNDGFKDIFVSNGVYRDIIDNDFLLKKTAYDKADMEHKKYSDMLDKIPQTRVKNFVYRNRGDLTFEDMGPKWGMERATNTNGTAYADLDMDGDLDIVANNLNEPSIIYENRSSLLGRNFLKVRLVGDDQNRLAIGAKIELAYAGKLQRQDVGQTRGYLSSSDYNIHFGLGSAVKIDSLMVTWPNGKKTLIEHPEINNTEEIHYDNSSFLENTSQLKKAPMFDGQAHLARIVHAHTESGYDDFEQELLLPHKLSELGPCLSVADVNGDNLEDVFIGGAKGHPAAVYLQTDKGFFENCSLSPWQEDRNYEDVGSVFFDSDGDGDLDLYVVSGSNEQANTALYQDRLYTNNGYGQFTRSENALPQMVSSGKAVDAADFDQDGDIDIVVGGRVVPGQYPKAPASFLLLNNNGIFSDATGDLAPGLSKIGMVTDLKFTDYDNDSDLDILMVGEWMGITFFENNNGEFALSNANPELLKKSGWWQSIAAGDIDNDGDTDYVLGNIGKNNKYHPTPDNPLHIYFNDFDNNGKGDIVLSKNEESKHYPIRGRECSSAQMPFIADKFPNYESFATASMDEIYGKVELGNSLHYQVSDFQSCVAINLGNGKFEVRYLPNMAQLSPLMAIKLLDLNADGKLDILAAGNFHETETETIRYDAGSGICLMGDGNGNFAPLTVSESGVYLQGNVRDMEIIQLADGTKGILVANNGGSVQLLIARQKAEST